jgi:hypothetical protein
MDATADLGIGNILRSHLKDIWTSQRMQEIRSSFGTEALNPTCKNCDMYRNLDLYRTGEGRERARINHLRHHGKIVKREEIREARPFLGG